MKSLFFLLLMVPTISFAQENLLQNPSLEDGDDVPAHWNQGSAIDGVEYSWERKVGQKSKACLCIKKTANRYFPIASWTQEIDRVGDAPEIRICAQVKATKASKAILDVLFLDADGKWISHEWVAFIGSKKEGDPPADHDWKEYSGSVKIPANTKKIVVGLQDYGPGTVCFTDVSAKYSEK